jgi:hypothetical protein
MGQSLEVLSTFYERLHFRRMFMPNWSGRRLAVFFFVLGFP